MRYLQRVVDEILAVLFDSRRQSCHGLVLNNFVACSGFKQLLAKFQAACQCLFSAVDRQEAQPEADAAAGKTAGETQSLLPVLMLWAACLHHHCAAPCTCVSHTVPCPYLVQAVIPRSCDALLQCLNATWLNHAIPCLACSSPAATSRAAATYYVTLNCRRPGQACCQHARPRLVHCQA